MAHHVPRLDCGCPARPGYTIAKGATTLTLCHHHGMASADKARAQGFTVIEHKVPV